MRAIVGRSVEVTILVSVLFAVAPALVRATVREASFVVESSAETRPASAEVEVTTIDRATVKGRLVALDAKTIVVETASTERKSLPAHKVVEVRFGRPVFVRHDHRSPLLRFELVGGDVVFGNVTASTFDDVDISGRSIAALKIPLDGLRRVVVLANTEGLPARFDADAAKDRDVLFIRSKSGVDRVVGEIARFRRDGVLFEWKDGEESPFDFAKNRVVAVRLAEEVTAEPLEGVHGVVHLRDGSRLTGTLKRTDGGVIQVRHGTGFTVALAEDSIQSIGLRGGDFVYVSDLAPAQVEEVPYFEGGLTYGVHHDVGLDGRAVSVGGVYFPKAICVHSKCSVSFDVSKGYTTFSTFVGLDDRVASRRVRGSVKFSVQLDGKPIGKPVVVRAGDAPVPLRGLDVREGKRLTLVADFADNFHFNGWAVFGGAMLVKGK